MAPKKADKGKGGGEEEREEPLQACVQQTRFPDHAFTFLWKGYMLIVGQAVILADSYENTFAPFTLVRISFCNPFPSRH
jgi:hypothetical protein